MTFLDSGSGDKIRQWLQSTPTRYILSLVAIAIAVGGCFGLEKLGPVPSVAVLFFPAVVLVAMCGGVGPGLIAVSLAVLTTDYFFLGPRGFSIQNAADGIALVLYLVIASFLVFLADSRKRAEQALRQRESDLKRAQSVAHVGSWRHDFAANTLNFSDEACRILRLPVGAAPSPESALGMVYPGDRERLRRDWAAAIDRGSYEAEARLQLGTEARWVRIYASFERDAKGAARAALGTVQDVTERKQADESLGLFRTLVDQSNDGVEVLDPETLRFLDINEQACRQLGYSREELLKMTAFDINPTIDESHRTGVLDKLDKSGFVVQESIHQRKDGSTFPVETSLRCVHLDRTYMVAVTRDISERKAAENALRVSEDRYRDLVEHSQDLLCTHDLKGELISVNPATAQLLEYEVNEILQIHMKQLIAPEFRKNFDEYLERIKVKGKDRGLLCVVTRRGERRVWEYDNTLRVEGVPEPIVRGMARDITDQKRAQRALQASESHFRILVEQASDGIFIADANGNYVDANSAGAEMLGYTREEILKIGIPDIIADSETPRVGEELARLDEGATTRSEWKFRRKDGSYFHGEVCAKRRPDGRLQGILRDMTERRCAEEALRQSEERFRVALKDSPITVFSQDADLRYSWIYNPHLYWQAEIVGKTDEEILGEEKGRVFSDLKRKALRTRAAVREDVMIFHDGRNYSFDVTVEPLFDLDNRIVGITGSAVDVARLRELADRLEEQREKLFQEKSYLESEIESELGFEEIIGQSAALREVLKKARVVAPTDSTVLLLGETGTGKELVARSIHSLSSRSSKSFIKLNCAAVPSGLLESELFGHEKGAFTGAVSQKVGRLELADQGTLFLDEIGELPLELQPKLLRVLQDREFERLGGVRTLRVDTRIISATNRDLMKDVADRKFREDLFYRLNVFPLELPALRERRSDIPMLVRHFVRKHATKMGRKIEIIPSETMRLLQNWNWPGNIRELENMIERMVIMTRNETLASPPVELEGLPDAAEDNLTEMEREHIIRVLRETGGVLSGAEGAANRLGIKRTTLQSMLKRFDIRVQDFRRGNGTLRSN